MWLSVLALRFPESTGLPVPSDRLIYAEYPVAALPVVAAAQDSVTLQLGPDEQLSSVALTDVGASGTSGVSSAAASAGSSGLSGAASPTATTGATAAPAVSPTTATGVSSVVSRSVVSAKTAAPANAASSITPTAAISAILMFPRNLIAFSFAGTNACLT